MSETPGDHRPSATALLAAARNVAKVRGWSDEDVAMGEVRGTLPFDEARAALSAAAQVEGQAQVELTGEECATLLAALAAWDVWPEATKPGPRRTRVIEIALEESRKVDALIEKLRGWEAAARERRTAEVEAASR